MVKLKRLLISPFIGRGCRSVMIAAALCCGLSVALLWRSLVGDSLSLAPPLAERDFGYLRRTRRLAKYLDDEVDPLIAPQAVACDEERSLPVVVLVSSSPAHVDARDAIRSTWGAELPTFFFMGRTGRARLNMDEQMVDNYMEAKQHSDIVVGDYVDSYENLTLKTSHMLRWAVHRCARARFLLKTDDDVLVNPWALRDVLRAHEGEALVGYKLNGSVPHRDRENKWYLPRWLYREDSIPEYLSGTGYLISGEHVKSIYETSFKVPLINLEDIFLTYLVARQKLGFNLTHEPRLSPYQPLVHSGCAYWRLASVHSLRPRQIWNVWPKIRALAELYQENGDPCRSFNRFFGFLSWQSFLV